VDFTELTLAAVGVAGFKAVGGEAFRDGFGFLDGGGFLRNK
jgi:hypothetical protein